MRMETRPLGRSGLCVPRLGLGTATFGREIDERTSFDLMDYAVEQGMTLFDSAEAYGGGEARDYRRNRLGVDDVREVSGEHHSSEKIIGRWLRSSGARSRVVLVTKVSTNFTRDHVREALHASLERLQTDFVDVYLFHQFDNATPLEQALEAMETVRQSGLAKSVGCSNFSAAQVRDALAMASRLGIPRVEAVEAICNLAARWAEADLLPLCRAEELGFLAYSPLGAGFLTGKYDGSRDRLPEGSRFHVIPGHMDIYFGDEQFRAVGELQAASERLGIPAPRLAIAWVLARPDVSSVLCGARTRTHIDNALAAAELGWSEDWLPGAAPSRDQATDP